MKYAAALEWLYGLSKRGIRLDLDRMHRALRLRGSEQGATKFVHVGGTNGKGSVSTLIASALRADGYRVGLYTSPHLHRFVERIRINGREISEREAAQRMGDVRRFIEKSGIPLTFFEATTLLALEAFTDAGCDVVVLEVGLGGRFDATNVIRPAVTVITNVAMDHMEYLGDSLALIAKEKAGIIKSRVPVVTSSTDAHVLKILRREATRVGAPFYRIGVDFDAEWAGKGTLHARFENAPALPLSLALRGAHQASNAACAYAALQLLKRRGIHVSSSAIRKGFAGARWPARLEQLAGHPAILLDAAHNPDGCRALAAHLKSSRRVTPKQKVVLVFAAMRDKDHRAMLTALRPHVDQIVFTAPDMSRAASPVQLKQANRGRGSTARTIAQAMVLARKHAGRSGLVVVAGSIFLVGPVRARLLRLRADPLIGM